MIDVKVKELFQKISIKYGAAGFLVAIFAYFSFVGGVAVYQEFQTSFAAKEFRQYGIFGTYQRHFFAFLGNLDEMKAIDQENEKLNQKVAELEKKIGTKEMSHAEMEAEIMTEEASKRLRQLEGSELARAMESIQYRPPANLSGNELYALALGYFRKNEYEQAAVIFTQLIHQKDDTTFARPENFLMCGISWYKLKEFRLASEDFSRAKKLTSPDDWIFRTASLWGAFLYEGEGKTQEAQNALVSMVEKFPHSEEVDWVNRNRKPAAQPKAGDKHE